MWDADADEDFTSPGMLPVTPTDHTTLDLMGEAAYVLERERGFWMTAVEMEGATVQQEQRQAG